MIKAALLINSMHYWAPGNYLCLVIFPSEVHQEHPCLLCREASQGHEGTLSYFLDPFLFPFIFNCSPLSIDLDLIRGLMSRRGGFTVKSNPSAPSTGSRDQGHHPDPHHGVPLWGRHVGHQAGLRAHLWEITVHSHLSKSRPQCFWGLRVFRCLASVRQQKRKEKTKCIVEAVWSDCVQERKMTLCWFHVRLWSFCKLWKDIK